MSTYVRTQLAPEVSSWLAKRVLGSDGSVLSVMFLDRWGTVLAQESNQEDLVDSVNTVDGFPFVVSIQDPEVTVFARLDSLTAKSRVYNKIKRTLSFPDDTILA